MLIFDKQLKKALEKIISRDARHENIEKHKAALYESADLLNIKDSNSASLFMTSKELYKKKDKGFIAELFETEKRAIKYKSDVPATLKVISIASFGLFAWLTFLGVVSSELTMSEKIIEAIKFLSLVALLSSIIFGISVLLTRNIYSEAIKNLKSKVDTKFRSDDLKTLRKGLIVTDNSVIFIDLTGYVYHELNEIKFSDILAVVVTSEDKDIERLIAYKGHDLVQGILPPDKVGKNETQKLNILARNNKTYSFVAPSGSNGEDAYEIAELIRDKASSQNNFMLPKF